MKAFFYLELKFYRDYQGDNVFRVPAKLKLL